MGSSSGQTCQTPTASGITTGTSAASANFRAAQMCGMILAWPPCRWRWENSHGIVICRKLFATSFYTPENWHSPWKGTTSKKIWSFNHQFSGDIIVLREVVFVSSIWHFRIIKFSLSLSLYLQQQSHMWLPCHLPNFSRFYQLCGKK